MPYRFRCNLISWPGFDHPRARFSAQICQKPLEFAIIFDYPIFFLAQSSLRLTFTDTLPTFMATGQKAKQKIVRLASGRKRARQAIKANANNSSLHSKLRTAIKAVRKAITGGDKKVATETFKTAQGVIDIIADKRIVHKNKASRDKSRLSAAVKAMA